VDDLWATKSEDVGLIVRTVSKIFNLCGPDPPMSQTDRQTDGRTDTRLLVYAYDYGRVRPNEHQHARCHPVASSEARVNTYKLLHNKR